MATLKLAAKFGVRCLYALLAVATGARCAIATSAVRTSDAESLQDYQYTSWNSVQGAPASIWVIAQTPDGWIWVGTPSGLYQFDGQSFKRFELLANDDLSSHSIGSLYVATNGDLWVLYSSGRAAVMNAGRPAKGHVPIGIPTGTAIDAVMEEPSGSMLALAGQRLFKLDQDRWTEIDRSRLGLTNAPVRDAGRYGGNLWAITGDGVYVMRQGGTSFARFSEQTLSESKLIMGGNGQLWRYTLGEGFVMIADKVALPNEHALHPPTSSPWIMDARGSLWSAVCGGVKLCRLGDASSRTSAITKTDAAFESLDASLGFPAAGAMTIFEDRDGVVWTGSKIGLERFRIRPFATVKFPEPLVYFAVVPNGQRGVWVGTSSRGLTDRWWDITAGKPVAFPAFEHEITAAFRDTDGTIFAGSSAGLWEFNGSQFHDVDIPEVAKGATIQALARDGEGSLWASFRGLPVFALRENHWLPKGGLGTLPDDAPATAVVDGSGGLWLGYFSNVLVHVKGKDVARYDAEQGILLGTTTAILPGQPMVIGGERGLAIQERHHFLPLLTDPPGAIESVTGLRRTATGDLWVNGSLGAIRIDAAEVARALKDPTKPAHVRIFNTDDGVQGGAQQLRPLPTVASSDDGRLWFAGTTGLSWIDPSAVGRNMRPAHPFIRSVTTPDGHYEATGPIQFPIGTRELRIRYTALDPAMADRVTFRYRLEGLDQTWREVGSLREATYTNLPSGHYRFLLDAANEDGIWTGAPTSFGFQIEPLFYERWWFVLLAGLLAIAGLWWVINLRLVYLKRRMLEQLYARHAERERIARDLHDTLLQGAQGLLLRLQVWAGDRTLSDRRRAEIREAIDHTRNMLNEGRDRIMDLRSGTTETASLGELLEKFWNETVGSSGVNFSLQILGGAKDVPLDVRDEMFAIAREALRNVLAHANAGNVAVRIDYGRHNLCVEIADDGCGIDDEDVVHGKSPGHWGIHGMRERAAALDGELNITRQLTIGTVLIFRIPAKVAYRRT